MIWVANIMYVAISIVTVTYIIRLLFWYKGRKNVENGYTWLIYVAFVLAGFAAAIVLLYSIPKNIVIHTSENAVVTQITQTAQTLQKDGKFEENGLINNVTYFETTTASGVRQIWASANWENNCIIGTWIAESEILWERLEGACELEAMYVAGTLLNFSDDQYTPEGEEDGWWFLLGTAGIFAATVFGLAILADVNVPGWTYIRATENLRYKEPHQRTYDEERWKNATKEEICSLQQPSYIKTILSTMRKEHYWHNPTTIVIQTIIAGTLLSVPFLLANYFYLHNAEHNADSFFQKTITFAAGITISVLLLSLILCIISKIRKFYEIKYAARNFTNSFNAESDWRLVVCLRNHYNPTVYHKAVNIVETGSADKDQDVIFATIRTLDKSSTTVSELVKAVEVFVEKPVSKTP